MQKLLCFLFALLSVVPAVTAQSSGDAVTQTIAACGKPQRSFLGATDSSAPIADRILKYRSYTLAFDRTSGAAVFRDIWDGTRRWTTVEDAKRLMPCLASTQFATPTMTALPDAHRTTNAHRDDSSAAAAGFSAMFLFLLLLGVASYMLPSIVSAARKVDRNGGIVALNVLLGWTLIGWVIALVWACSAETKRDAMLREMAYRNMAGMQPPPGYR